jgi:8-oxo-dGTP pyrophosphatase MutT (NUDIX family)
MKAKKAKKVARRGDALAQVGALPFRRTADGVEFLLLTSRQTSRFIIPKGWRMKGKNDPQAAAKEAEQEAGITGRIHPDPVGAYRYWKRLKNAFVQVRVTVYALEVEGALPTWKERGQRRRQWLTPDQAARLVDEPELVSLLQEFRP